ncbi:MAG TPA: class I SAM-dependent methyltransferase [Bacteroidia bacterium]|nr:class I SAM-dependent methyltransferase [Bacteroidia bacterium]OQB62649.1 MAG: bifunctional 3-demethylubiquinone-9 3-methyltransferase/ 2-octaprenyl-6-hydroxy phenol methylase [Bacteroidetes bacterium ADurb.Bin141]HNR49382.1 class I SAM-dependent methyltransferase [Bacteroidia bacterium]HNT81861.1 class I SAM-dependent methyltransferase [Bacteroidia bacterium]
MHYDPIKRSLGEVFNKTPFLRKIFYRLLDLLLLRAWHIHKELKPWLRQYTNGADVLDAGAGFGQYTYWLSRKNNKLKIYAVDVKEEQVRDCNNFFKAIGYNNVLFGVEDLVVYQKPDAYNLIVCVDVMEHILEDEKVFSNYVASLKKGGMLIISTPSDQGGSDVHEGGDTSFIEEHVRDGYNIKDIEQKLLRAGFSRVDARYSYGSPGKISWRLSMKYPISLLGVSKLFFVVLPFYYLLVYPICYVLNYADTAGNHPTGTGLIVKAWKD